jgi:hypothetical protein
VFARDKKYSLKDSAIFTGFMNAVTKVLVVLVAQVMLEVGRMSI